MALTGSEDQILPITLPSALTGCGCLVLLGVLAGLLYVFLRGSTDAGEPVEQ